MRTDIPASIRDTAHDLTPDAMIKLFRIELTNGTIFHISPTVEYNWLGTVYAAIPCTMTEMRMDADGKLARPKLTVANPNGIFSTEVYNRRLDNASVTRIRVLKNDLEANRDFAIRETFRVSRILNMNKTMLVLEMRDMLDGHQFLIPARAFYPPEFPHVKLF